MKKTVAIIGSSGAIGSAFCKSLLLDHSIEKIYKFARNNIDKDSDNEINISIDIEDEDSIKKAIEELPENIRFDLIFVATGILHNDDNIFPEKSIKDISIDKLKKVFMVNTFGPTLLGKYFIPLLNREKSVFAFLSARVGSISDNVLGGW